MSLEIPDDIGSRQRTDVDVGHKVLVQTALMAAQAGSIPDLELGNMRKPKRIALGGIFETHGVSGDLNKARFAMQRVTPKNLGIFNVPLVMAETAFTSYFILGNAHSALAFAGQVGRWG